MPLAPRKYVVVYWGSSNTGGKHRYFDTLEEAHEYMDIVVETRKFHRLELLVALKGTIDWRYKPKEKGPQ